MTATFTINSARNAGEKPNPHGGTLVKWYLKLTDSEAGDEDVYCQKKPGNDLAPGMEITGRLEKGEYGWRLFPESQPGNFPKVNLQRDNGLSKDDYWRNKEARDVESQARQGRAHAQEMALRFDANNLAAGGRSVANPEELVTVIDWFHQDVQRFPLDADVGGEERPSHSPAADMSAEASPQLKGKATQLLNKAGLAEGARKAVILFRCGTLKNPPKGRVQSLVTDLEQGATAEALLAEISDAWGNGDEVAAEAVKLIPPGAPVDTEGLPELDAEGKQILGIKDEEEGSVPF